MYMFVVPTVACAFLIARPLVRFSVQPPRKAVDGCRCWLNRLKQPGQASQEAVQRIVRRWFGVPVKRDTNTYIHMVYLYF